MKYLTLEQAAERVGKTPRTLQVWVKSGALAPFAAIRRGGRKVQYFEELAVLEADRSRKPGRPPKPVEGSSLYRLPSSWRRDVSGAVERAEIPEPVGDWYQVSGELLEVLLRDAGWSPSLETSARQAETA